MMTPRAQTSQLEETCSPVFGSTATCLWLSITSKRRRTFGKKKKICREVFEYVFVCPSVCVLPPNPENRHSSAEDLPTKFTKGYWERPKRTEILCTAWMWPWEVWETAWFEKHHKVAFKKPPRKETIHFRHRSLRLAVCVLPRLWQRETAPHGYCTQCVGTHPEEKMHFEW